MLQVGRCFGTLVQLVRAGHEQRPALVAEHARMIAEAVLFGARDRNAGKFTRTLFHLQSTRDPLRQPRRARARPTAPARRTHAKHQKAGA